MPGVAREASEGRNESFCKMCFCDRLTPGHVGPSGLLFYALPCSERCALKLSLFCNH